MAACKDRQGHAVLGLGVKDLLHALPRHRGEADRFSGSSFLLFLKMGAMFPYSSHL